MNQHLFENLERKTKEGQKNGPQHKKSKEGKEKELERRWSSSSSSIPSMPTKVWQPGVDKLGEEEELECDPTAYNSLHALHIGWPCLSFDVVRDSLGLLRTDFPHTVFCCWKSGRKT
ncbi:hypothetical protein OIU84_006421 [Salix udensis]|uniref:Histone-binding protein RBBP4-like N-terminal domain-containing protein n=1 Tax=Salix udensis TaxID=889485 RepID=A0AAD6JYD5_9ROSI|nr:hypothetical protein OIU84_006421 [Salix udensis]